MHTAVWIKAGLSVALAIRPLTGEADGQPKDATWAASITGVTADTKNTLARPWQSQ